MPTTMLTLITTIRQNSIYRQLFPSENVGIGWPIPFRRQSKVYVTLPFFGQVYDRQLHQTLLYPPFALITLEWVSQRPVEYLDLRFRHPWQNNDWETHVGTFPHPALAELDKAQYENTRTRLFAMYDEMMEALVDHTALSSEQEIAFRALLRQMVEPGLEPYYRELGHKFFDHFLAQASI